MVVCDGFSAARLSMVIILHLKRTQKSQIQARRIATTLLLFLLPPQTPHTRDQAVVYEYVSQQAAPLGLFAP